MDIDNKGTAIANPLPNPTLLDTTFLASRDLSPVVIHLFAKFTEPLNIGLLRDAVKLLFVQVPVLGCQLANGKWVPASFNAAEQTGFVDLGALPKDEQQEHAEQLLWTFIANDPTPGHAPQLKCALIRTTMSDVLLLQVHHTAMDGGGLKQLFNLLATNYSLLSEDKTPNTETRVDPSGQALATIRRAMTPSHLSKASTVALNEQRRFLSGERPTTLPPQSLGSPGFASLILPRSPVLSMLSKTNPEATINDFLLSTLALTFLTYPEAERGPLIRICLTVDLRKYLNANARVYSNLTSLAQIEVAGHCEPTFGSVLEQTVKETKFLKQNYIGLPMLATVPSFSPIGPVRQAMMKLVNRLTMKSGRAAPILTNFGAIDPDHCVFAEQAPEEVSLTPSIPRNGLGFLACATGYGENLSIHLAHCDIPHTSSIRLNFANAWAGTIAGLIAPGTDGKQFIGSGLCKIRP